jgi:hypothetical protein
MYLEALNEKSKKLANFEHQIAIGQKLSEDETD